MALSLQRTRPHAVASPAGRWVTWLLSLAFSLVFATALLGTASASPSKSEGEYGELATEQGQDGESVELDAEQACTARRTHSGTAAGGYTRIEVCVPRLLTAIAARPRPRPRPIRRTAPAVDDDDAQV